MNQAMIDLETLSTEDNAAIISIGAAIFNDKDVIATEGWAIHNRHWHGHIDPATVAWWADQDRDGAREYSFTGKLEDFTAAFGLKTFLAQYNVQEVWANDPHFDYIILRAWWKRIGTTDYVGYPRSPMAGEFPITYRQPRSYRTIVGEAERLGYNPKEHSGIYVAHNPVDDAASQARVVIAARKMIDGSFDVVES